MSKIAYGSPEVDLYPVDAGPYPTDIDLHLATSECIEVHTGRANQYLNNKELRRRVVSLREAVDQIATDLL